MNTWPAHHRLNVAMARQVKSSARFVRLAAWCLGFWAVAVVIGWAPNPVDRFFEAGPRTYRNFADVVQVSNSIRLRYAVKDVLERDRELNQANLKSLWPLYMQALPDGYTFPENADAVDVSVERQRLVKAVGASL
ncbi:MAG: hypothetical protein E6Q67_04995 [Roseateles sp.]|nr:MAG: hypothetical protein E6Q67_04995 [Roseateles sp.]